MLRKKKLILDYTKILSRLPKTIIEEDEEMGMEGRTSIPSKEKAKIRAALIEFFKKNPNPPDSKIHAFAAKLNIAPNVFEEQVYALLGSLLKEDTQISSKKMKAKEADEENEADEEAKKKNSKKIKDLRENIEYLTEVLKKSDGSEETEMLFELLSEIPVRLEKVKPEDLDKEILRLSMIAELDAASIY